MWEPWEQMKKPWELGQKQFKFKIFFYTYHYYSNTMLDIQCTRLNLREFINKENLHMCKSAIFTGVKNLKRMILKWEMNYLML